MKTQDVNGKRLAKHTKTGTKTKVCTYCGKRKDRDKFVTGRMCIACKTSYDKARYLAKKEEIDGRMKAYGKTERGYEVNKKATAAYYERNGYRKYVPLKGTTEHTEFLRRKNAHNKVHYAMKTGKLVKGVCEICGCSDVHAHHDDYDRPLEVRWLCVKHHGMTRRIETGGI